MLTILNLLRFILIAGLTLLVAIFAVRAVQAMRGPSLQLWHTHVPDEPGAAEIDGMNWQAWLKREDTVFAEVKSEIVDKLPREEQRAQNRYWSGSPMNPARRTHDWNRSFELMPEGAPAGVAVLLHGLTDGPYSLRHFARHYQSRGWAVIGVRLPGHGTVPAALTKANVEQWEAATRLGMREAARLAPGMPIHIVGYSNGGALAVGHALDALDKPDLVQPQALVLVSPMIGLTPFARFTGLAAIPAALPAFVNAAWLDILPEYNPYKYNSFPVNAGAEAHRLTQVLTGKLGKAKSSGAIRRMPPVLAFQSVVDSTVSAQAVVTALFDQLPANGSELVLVDVNHAAYVGPMLRPSASGALDRLLPNGPRNYRIRVITNASPDSQETVVRTTEAGATGSVDVALVTPYRRDFFSLGHVALPFPLGDGLYGANPDPADVPGVALGALATRGENGVLGISPAALARVSSNPFLPWMLEQVDQRLTAAAPAAHP